MIKNASLHCLFLSWLCLVLPAMSPSKPGGEELRDELSRVHAQTGLSLVGIESDTVLVVSFENRTTSVWKILPPGAVGEPVGLSSDGSVVALAYKRQPAAATNAPEASGKQGPGRYLALAAGGSAPREYPHISEPLGVCWSQQKSQLALWAVTGGQSGPRTRGLHIFKLESGQAELVAEKGLAYAPCWSPDGESMVYVAGSEIRIYDVGRKESRFLVSGEHPTWSPDGKWIAYRLGDEYHVISPDRVQRKFLFKKPAALTPLWWSPDSRYVAYVSPTSGLESARRLFRGTSEEVRLRVRRLDDGAEDWFLRFAGKAPLQYFQWVSSTAFLQPQKAEPR